MAERRGRWTPEQLQMFQEAWGDMERKLPAMQERVAEFNGGNGMGLVAMYDAKERVWGTLAAIKVREGFEEVPSEFVVPSWMKASAIQDRLTHPLSEEEITYTSGFAAQLGEDFGFRVIRNMWDAIGLTSQDMRQSKDRPVYNLSYSIKPHFKF